MGFQTPAYDKLLTGWQERKSRMMKLRKDGVPDSEIAKTFGVSRARIGQLLGAKRKRRTNGE